jgi:putative membrane protein
MLGLIGKILAALFGNGLGLWLAGRYIDGVTTPQDLSSVVNIQNLLIAAAVLTGINILVRPLLRLVLSPIIMLTFGLGLILVNAITLYLLDQLMDSVTIVGLLPLLYATLVLSVVNFIVRKI